MTFSLHPMGRKTVFAVFRLLGFVVVLVGSQATWFVVDLGGTSEYLFSPGRSGTSAGLILTGSCVFALIAIGVDWLRDETHRFVIPEIATAAISGVLVHQLLTLPGSVGPGGGHYRLALAMPIMIGGVLVVIVSDLCLRRGRSATPPDLHVTRVSNTAVRAAGFLLAVAAFGSLLPWFTGRDAYGSTSENPMLVGTGVGIGLLLTFSMAFLAIRRASASGVLVRTYPELIAISLLAICGTQLIRSWDKFIRWGDAGPGAGLWLMTATISSGSLGLVLTRLRAESKTVEAKAAGLPVR